MPRQELNVVRFSSIATIDDIQEAGSSGDPASAFFASPQRNVTAIYSSYISCQTLVYNHYSQHGVSYLCCLK